MSLGTNVYFPEFTHVCVRVHLRLGESGHIVAALNMRTCICDSQTSVSSRKSEHMRRILWFQHVSVSYAGGSIHMCVL